MEKSIVSGRSGKIGGEGGHSLCMYVIESEEELIKVQLHLLRRESLAKK